MDGEVRDQLDGKKVLRCRSHRGVAGGNCPHRWITQSNGVGLASYQCKTYPPIPWVTKCSDGLQYGLNSVAIMASVGGVYFNFALWAVSLLPAWLVVRKFGEPEEDGKIEKIKKTSDIT